MAITMNTTKTIERTSSVLGKKCEETKRNMKKLMRDAGFEEYQTKTVTLPLLPGSRDDVAFVGLNGASFYFRRGEKLTVPAQIEEIMRRTKMI